MSVVRAVTFSIVAVLLTAGDVRAQSYSPYSDFQNLTAPELASLQVKLTYLGPVDHPMPSLVFTSTSGTINVSDFTPYRRNGFASAYGLDNLPPATFKVSPTLLDAMIDSVATLPQITDGGVDSSWYVSFAMVETVSGTRGFESILDGANSTALVGKILAAFAGQSVPTRVVTEAACPMGIMEDNPPPDVTSSVTIKTTGFRRVRGTDEFVGRVTVKNTSGSTLPAPVTLLPGIVGENVVLMGEQGFTCAIDPGGEAYLNLSVGGGGLAPNASVNVNLRIKNPSLERVEVKPQVFAGAGTR
jgi:hypothetical protein